MCKAGVSSLVSNRYSLCDIRGRDLENLEDGKTDRNVDQDQWEFHLSASRLESAFDAT